MAKQAEAEGDSSGPQESGRKALLVRLPAELHAELRTWANAELRSLNAHIEWILREAVRKRNGPSRRE